MRVRKWNIVSLIVQELLSVTLLWAGYTKLFTPASDLAEMWPWTVGNRPLVMIVGIVDIVGGLGIILPSLLKAKPQLIVYAAWGIVLLMLSAALFHISKGEASNIGINVLILVLALFVIRMKKT
ncbi:DoxX family protein [Sphingobacterium haloxyli]|uniref:DoxX family protein n=1 Tax=Sphingobacterium haloxyli TaxID=2100533 RepID=A0A2S9J6Y3_9SPHI|nr:DoxX family protein [Sphingobacterium haloxyli]PRD48545.1 hypothetical protein C5745_04910 [Sphingobacterium haloxyli]